MAGGLHRLPRNIPHARRKLPLPKNRLLKSSNVSEILTAYGLGQYVAKFILNGDIISAIMDTGSGVGQLACTGAAVEDASLVIYDPATATPPFNLVPQISAMCTTLCSHTDGCYSNPAVAGACEYLYAYGGGNALEGRAYTATLTFPSSVSNIRFPGFLFGCSFKTTTNPYMYSNFNALFGMDWEPTSMWNQMTTISNGVISDTLYLCLGDGGDLANTSSSAQAGVIVFGSPSSVKVTGSSVGGRVVNVTMWNSSTLESNGRLLLQPPGMWATLQSFNLVTAGGSTTALSMNTSNYYLHTGTSEILLVEDAFNALKEYFCPAITALSNSSFTFQCAFFNNVFEIEIVGATSIWSKAGLFVTRVC
ncbi:hypothetical protein CEUSTIGMA_g12706.t1 [Chlamydomonas eustigma]|uniref:Peptidase A1 domain-containing protein n=1 Tax=Chlamydomonas eustigma TaxID=1157962 RepID=A0A250XQR0_9CHLO|nr:hypothetical protein CEUSTIGMA_g12706.t1 [Chlamydomonas eustigma]|eukprot:GAX85289.1 hypothetical protein CEUSTIGMA_g12706.t1 [Chlamydomonas eustigma]